MANSGGMRTQFSPTKVSLVSLPLAEILAQILLPTVQASIHPRSINLDLLPKLSFVGFPSTSGKYV